MSITVRELKEFLAPIDDDFTVRGYEGEGGSWIVVDTDPREPPLEINTGK